MTNPLGSIVAIFGAILIIVLTVVGLRRLFQFFLSGARETWTISGKLGPIGHGIFIAIWIFFFPIALVITLITGWSITKQTSSAVQAAEIPQYERVLKSGESVTSNASNPYLIELYPGVQISLPTGTWVLLREGDPLIPEGSVFLDAIYSGDKEYYSRYLGTGTLQPSFIWIVDKNSPPNFLQVTVTDSRNENPVTESTIDENAKFLRSYHERDNDLDNYSLELKQLNLPGWHNDCLVEIMRFRDKERPSGTQYHSYTISLQQKPLNVVLSTTCCADRADQYTELVLRLANSYRVTQ